jgi:hypothetical protein
VADEIDIPRRAGQSFFLHCEKVSSIVYVGMKLRRIPGCYLGLSCSVGEGYCKPQI